MEILKFTDSIPDEVINIHKEAFKGFFLTSLGDKFLKVYYSAVAGNNKGILLCIKKNENIIGFAAGTQFSNKFHSKILKENIISFAWVLIKNLLIKPGSFIRLFKNMSKKTDKRKDDGNYAELLSIGVHPDEKGKGYGKILLEAFESELGRTKVKRTTLTTDYDNNEDVIAFYKKMGYVEYDSFIAYPDRKMYKLIKEL